MSRTTAEIFPKSGDTLAVGAHLWSIAHKELCTVGGEAVPLRSQSAAVLAVLAARAGEVVAKSELMDAVWAGVAVTDDSLVQCIADIRRALGDDGHRVVRTFPKKGYRLEPGPQAPAGNGRSRATPARSRCLGAPVESAAPSEPVPGRYFAPPAGPARDRDMPRIAVLPFDHLSTGADKDYLSDAIAEGIITELAYSKSYAVVARNSSFRYRDAPVDVRRIGEELGVDYVLEGSQQKIGDRLKVMAQLVDVRDGANLWARVYDRRIGDLFAVQEEIIRALAMRVGIRIKRPLPPSDPDRVSALHHYLAGHDAFANDHSAETHRILRRTALEAIEADPSAQFGYINMALSYWAQANWGWVDVDCGRAEALRRGAAYAERAIELAPDDAKAHFFRARIHGLAGEVDEALARYDHAVALHPSDSTMLIGTAGTLLFIGHTDEAIRVIERAKGFDPLYPYCFDWQMSWALWEQQDFEGALRTMRRMERIPQAAHRRLASYYAGLGDREKARQAMAVFLQGSPASTLSGERRRWTKVWTAPGSLDRYIENLRFAGMPE